uniref:Putative secreted protein n=1 Tax=Anopheles darlingi TaxID=43151 RepID=A0A2M4D9W5_ANODA
MRSCSNHLGGLLCLYVGSATTVPLPSKLAGSDASFWHQIPYTVVCYRFAIVSIDSIPARGRRIWPRVCASKCLRLQAPVPSRIWQTRDEIVNALPSIL